MFSEFLYNLMSKDQ